MAYPGYQPSNSSSPFSSGQTGARRASVTKADISRDLDIARGRKEFFSNNPNVSDDRALRRMKQADETQRFKNLYTKPVAGSSNLLQMTADAPRSLAEERMRLANIYGPTPTEILGDMGRGIGSMMSGLAKLPGQAIEAYKQFSPVGRILQGAQNFFKPVGQDMRQLGNNIQGGISSFFDLFKGESQFAPPLMPQAPGSIPNSRERSMANLTPLQQVVYDQVINLPGKTHGDALSAAMRQNYANNYQTYTTPKILANGGIATFN